MNSIFTTITAVNLFIGVLEQPMCKEDNIRFVRVLFEKQQDGWNSCANPQFIKSSFPSQWTVSFDGRNLGNIVTSDPGWNNNNSSTYSRDRLLNLVGDSPVVRNNDTHFHGWCAYPLFRPLIVINRPNVTDPSCWKKSYPAQDIRNSVFPEFKKHVGKQFICPVDPEKRSEFHFSEKHLVQLTCYSNIIGFRLVAVSLDPSLNQCDGPPDPAWFPNWFLVPVDSQHSNFIGDGLWLIDAGDYDADGNSEVIFWYSGYNLDGYVMFTSNFKNRVEYLWSYH
jgi:hypothetical protein